MGRAHARAERVDQYLTVPRHGRAELRLVEPAPAPVRSLRPDWLPEDLLAPEEPAPLAELPALEAPTRARSSSSRDRAAGEELVRVTSGGLWCCCWCCHAAARLRAGVIPWPKQPATVKETGASGRRSGVTR